MRAGLWGDDQGPHEPLVVVVVHPPAGGVVHPPGGVVAPEQHLPQGLLGPYEPPQAAPAPAPPIDEVGRQREGVGGASIAPLLQQPPLGAWPGHHLSLLTQGVLMSCYRGCSQEASQGGPQSFRTRVFLLQQTW